MALTNLPFTPSNVKLDTYAGYGSTNTRIGRFTNNTVVGDSISYSASATLGDTLTINKSGIYSITAIWDSDNANDNWGFGLTLNSTELTTDIQSLTNRRHAIALSYDNAKGVSEDQNRTVTYVGPLSATDIVRLHAGSGAKVPASPSKCSLIITRLS